jgi:spore photoproduct lyase
MQEVKIGRVLVERGAENDSLTQRILDRLPDVPRETVEPHETALPHGSDEMDKESLRLMNFKGEFLKPCPGTKRYICCGYQILNVGINCPMDCSYCFLQSYMNQPSLRVYTNLQQELEIIGNYIDKEQEKIFRIGTGEFTDSLALDRLTGWTEVLLPFFSRRENCILELKTKASSVQSLLKSGFRQGIIVAWSLNTPHVIEHEEYRTAPLEERILAARECQKDGFLVAFHFDPLVHSYKWQEGLDETVALLEKYIDPKSVIWISLGSFRYMPSLKWAIKRRFPRTEIFNGEFVTGLDGKFRYFKPIRIDMYSTVAARLKQWHDDLGIYLCMEGADVWEQSLGWVPHGPHGLSTFLDNRVRKLVGKRLEPNGLL